MSIRADSLAAHGAEGRNGGDVRLGEPQAKHGNEELAHEHSMSSGDVGGFADELEAIIMEFDK